MPASGSQSGFDLRVLDVHMRAGGEFDGAEQAVQTPEVLILQPGGAGVFVAGDGHDVLPSCSSSVMSNSIGREAVLAIADERAVDPQVDRRGHAVEHDRHLIRRPAWRFATGAETVNFLR